MEQVNPWLQLAAVVVPALVGSILLYRSSRKDTDKTGEGGFRDDLLARIDQQDKKAEAQDKKIAALEVRVEERDQRIEEMRRELAQMHDDLRRQRDVNAEQAAHITVLTEWGIHALGDPPRTPPPWRQA